MPLADDLRYLIEYDILKVLRILRGLATDLPRSYETRLLLGDAYLRGLQFAEAMEQYRAAAAIERKARAPLLKIALCHVYTGQYEPALALFERLHQTARDEHALALAGLMLHRLGRPGEAVERYRKLISIGASTNHDVAFGMQGLMLALRDTGRLLESDAAAAQLQELIRQRPEEMPFQLHSRNSSYDHFEWSLMADKGRLAELLVRHARQNPDNRFFPDTFILPEQRAALLDHAARQPAGSIYIMKPRHGQGGQSIRLTEDVGIAGNAADHVVQRYIDSPYLVDGKKAHLRIYGLVVASEPLRVYVYKDGIVRFAPEKYERGTNWLERVGMHVTNTALHRHHPALVISQDPMEENVGNIWSLKAYLARIAEDGHDAEAIFGDIARLVRRFVHMLDSDGVFARQRRMGPARGFVPKLFGLDVLLDDAARPWLIEIQRSPAWKGPPLVTRINNIVAATLARMTVNRLVVDGMSPASIASVLSDPASLARRELEIEERNRGLFVPVVSPARTG